MKILQRFLEHKLFPWLLVLLVFLLWIPALWQGFLADDYIHRIVFLGLEGEQKPSFSPVMNLFYFFGDNPETIRGRMSRAGPAQQPRTSFAW